ncbi:hypothetical protein ACIBP4_06290 [Micromonospora maritima]|uniref:Uncharacterized protein n=1 Tax=Micromonospora maritima TaxID=986711 RepID=A0ABW7ZGC7_9ACTN
MDAPRLDQETVERLLVGSADGPLPLARLLDAVRVPPGTGEVTGEAAAVAAFREARAGAVGAVGAVRPGGRTPRAARPTGGSGPGDRRRAVPRDDTGRRPLRRFAGLGGKLAVAAVIASFGGGVALAAATGNLPGPAGDRTPADGASGSGRPVAGLPPTPHPDGRAVDPTPSATDPPTPARLCTAYHRLAEPERNRALRTPAFAGLVAAAGSPGRVPGYCADLLPASGTAGPGGALPPGGAGPPGADRSGPSGPDGSGPPGPDGSGPPGPGASGPPQATAAGGSGHPLGPTGRRPG